MADDNANDAPNLQDLDKTPADEKPVPQSPPPAIARPDLNQNPPASQYPAPSTEEGDQLKKEVTEAQEALRQQLEDSKRLEQRANDFDRDYQAGMKQIQADISQADKDRATPPELLPLQSRSEADLHAHNNLQWSWPNTLFTLGVGLLGTLGKHGHGTLSNYFLGSFFQAYAAGQQERQKEMEEGWHRTNEAIYKENELRLSEYRSKLADEKLSLDSKIQLMKNLADQYKDLPMIKAIQTNNLTNIRTALSNAEKGLHDFRQRQRDAWKAQNTLAKKGSQEALYESQAKSIFMYKYGREPATPEDWAQAHKDFTLHDFYKNRKLYGVDDKGNAIDPAASPSATPSASATPTPSPTPTDADLSAAIKQFEAGQK